MDADAIIGAVVVAALLLDAAAWFWAKHKSERKSYERGYAHGYERGDRDGFARYSAQLDGTVQSEAGRAYRRAAERYGRTPRAQWD